ncbi:MAG: LON peptidase substrate-binding domain-containing protein [Anaerolineae bacterium]|nr:LON peptidase substrate-binding domain-containing protein [Anaerolineae bacterium]
MQELPLFPLNTVLFPGMPISLHIFEPRYQLMINQCIKNEQSFGIVLIAEGQEALGPLATPHPVGCIARITQVERLENGRMTILAIGQERFQVQSLKHDQPYLIGTVEPLPLNKQNTQRLQEAGQQLRPLVERYLSILSAVVQPLDFTPGNLPDDPLALAYLAATIVQIPAEQKQPLLAVDNAVTLLSDMRAIYLREVALLQVMIERDPRENGATFSRN